MGAEEPQVDGVGRQPAVEGHQCLGVVGADGAQLYRPTVGGHGRPLEVRRVPRGASTPGGSSSPVTPAPGSTPRAWPTATVGARALRPSSPAGHGRRPR